MSILVGGLILLAVAAKPQEAPKMPAAVMSDVEYSREMCRALGQRFSVDMDCIETLDFNNDQKPDYIMDTRGFYCSKITDKLFGSSSGKPFYLYLSKPDGKWEKAFNAYVYEYNIKRDYGELPYFDVWIRGEVGYQANLQRLQWNGDEVEVVEQEMGVQVPDQLWKSFD